MSLDKVKASKLKVHTAPAGTSGLDGMFHVYVYDVFHKAFHEGKAFETIEKAAHFQRREQERIFQEQEADPELFDLPFISDDPDLLGRIERDPAYGRQLVTALEAEARDRARRR
jgi:hypothetical protein